MRFPRGLLADDEEVVLDSHPHWKRLVRPAAAVPVVAGVAAYAVTAMPDGSSQSAARWLVVAATLVVLAVVALVPWLRWRTTRYLFTTRRVVTRSGVLARTGRDVPLTRVNDVTFSVGLLNRLLRCGDLQIESGGERGQLVLADLPEVQRAQRQLSELVEAATSGRGGERGDRWDRGDPDDPEDAGQTVRSRRWER